MLVNSNVGKIPSDVTLDPFYKKHANALGRRLNDPDGLQCSLCNQALVLAATGNFAGSMKLLKEEEAICRRLNDYTGLNGILGNQALILQNTGDLESAIKLLEEQEAICRRLDDSDGLQRRLGNKALILKSNGDLDAALRLPTEQEAICRRLNNSDRLARSLLNQGSLLAADLHLPTEGLPLAEKAAHLAAKHGLRALAQQIEPTLNRIRALPSNQRREVSRPTST